MASFRVLIVTFGAMLLLAKPLSAQSAQDSDATDRDIIATSEALTTLRSTIADGEPAEIKEAEAALRRYLAESRDRLTLLQRQESETRSELALLPPAPEAQATDEGGDAAPVVDDPVAERRSILNARLATVLRQIAAANANIVSINDLLAQVSARQVQGLYQRLLERGPLLVSPPLWSEALQDAAGVRTKIEGFFGKWGEDGKTARERLASALIALVFSGFIAGLFFGPIQQTLRNLASRVAMSGARRIGAGGLGMLARLAPGLIAGFVILQAARLVGLLPAIAYPVVLSLYVTFAVYLAITGFASSLLRPPDPSLALADDETRRTRRIVGLVTALSLTAGVAASLLSFNAATVGSPASAEIVKGVAAAIMGPLLFLLFRRVNWVDAAPAENPPAAEEIDEIGAVAAAASNAAGSDEEKRPAMSSGWRFLRRLGRTIGLITLVGSIAGYGAFAYFLSTRVVIGILGAALLWFVRLLARELSGSSGRPVEAASSDNAGETSRFWIGLSIDTALLFLAAPLALLLVGVSFSGVRDLAARAFLGFEIGGVSVSIARILYGVGLFAGIIFATRFLRRSLEKSVFSHARMDRGVQNSLNTLIGYIGLVIAFMVGVTALGFDLSNLAIIAGALSVGIGFGLQSIVNNFVSGLILLFERPVKAGDWIVTASGEGIVKKISVRSTEIETFDRASIIIPNSELVASTVTNWTHRNALGRVIVPVGVSYDSDPDEVMAILRKCAVDHPLTLRYPEPFVVWNDFGASSLDFDVRAFIPDVSKSLTVRTELRTAIFKALKEANISIPFPQHDVHIIPTAGVEIDDGAKKAGATA